MIIFSLRLNGVLPVKQFYSGDLQCFPDMETMVFINISDIEKYIAGVVKAEGGSGQKPGIFQIAGYNCPYLYVQVSR